jgi:hypothetical protein
MLQGGDPTGTGSGGDSYWGGTFKVITSFFLQTVRQLFNIAGYENTAIM